MEFSLINKPPLSLSKRLSRLFQTDPNGLTSRINEQVLQRDELGKQHLLPRKAMFTNLFLSE